MVTLCERQAALHPLSQVATSHFTIWVVRSHRPSLYSRVFRAFFTVPVLRTGERRNLEYQEINVTATAQLAEAAATAGVAQFVFVSSMNIVPAEAGAPDAEVGGPHLVILTRLQSGGRKKYCLKC